MKILVTGSSGMLGSLLMDDLKKRNWELVPYDIKEGQDVLDYGQLVGAMEGCDMVVHLAAIPHPHREIPIDQYFDLNVVGTYNVARASSRNKIQRLVYASSISYYGINASSHVQTPLVEDQMILTQYHKAGELNNRPGFIYGQTKVLAENILAIYGLYKTYQVIILRLAPIIDSGYSKLSGKFWRLKTHNAVGSIVAAITCPNEVWYEAFNIAEEDVEGADTTKAARMLGFVPQP